MGIKSIDDHIPVHHTNEIAQSECAFGKKPWVKYWLHGAFLTNKGGEKISKSKGGLFTISELQEEGFHPVVYRYFNLTTHYRKQLSFSIKNLESAKNAYERLKRSIRGLKDSEKVNQDYLKEFEEAINNDMNMPEALQILWKLVKDKKAKGKIKTIEKMDEVFGLDLLKKEKVSVPAEIKKLASERDTARKEKDWKKSDNLRDKIKKLGYKIDDTGNGSKIMKIKA